MRKLIALQGIAGVVLVAVGLGMWLGVPAALIAAGLSLLVAAWGTR